MGMAIGSIPPPLRTDDGDIVELEQYEPGKWRVKGSRPSQPWRALVDKMMEHHEQEF
jgi:hypothetical protein